jgi:hypothetical protein
MEEIWKPVPSKEGIKAISFGRILLPERQANMPHGGFRNYKTKPTYGGKRKATKTARHEYMGYYSKFFGNLKVHRLVCEAFHGPPPFPNAVVIHLDENALNNRPENLKWGTQKENLNMPGFKEYCRNRRGNKSPVTIGKNRKVSATPNLEMEIF